MTRRGRVLVQGALMTALVAGGLTAAARPAAADHCRRHVDVVVTRDYCPEPVYVPVVPVRVVAPVEIVRVRDYGYRDRCDDAPVRYFRGERHHRHWDH